VRNSAPVSGRWKPHVRSHSSRDIFFRTRVSSHEIHRSSRIWPLRHSGLAVCHIRTATTGFASSMGHPLPSKTCCTVDYSQEAVPVLALVNPKPVRAVKARGSLAQICRAAP